MRIFWPVLRYVFKNSARYILSQRESDLKTRYLLFTLLVYNSANIIIDYLKKLEASGEKKTLNEK